MVKPVPHWSIKILLCTGSPTDYLTAQLPKHKGSLSHKIKPKMS